MSGSNRQYKPSLQLMVTIIVGALAAAMYWAMFYDMGFQSGYHAGDSKVQSGRYANNAAQQIEQECSAKSGSAAHKCIAGIIKFQRESQRSESDLAAQWKAANWAEWSTIIASFSVLVTGIGTYLLFQQIILTREALSGTGEATQAMVRQNEISEVGQRPWVVLLQMHQTEISRMEVAPGDYKNGVSFNAEWVNVGTTPAIAISWATGIALSHNFSAIPLFDVASFSETVAIPQGLTGKSYPEILLGEDASKILNGKAAAFFFGRVQYHAVGNPDIIWTTEICIKIYVNGMIENGVKRMPNFMFIPIGPQNVLT